MFYTPGNIFSFILIWFAHYLKGYRAKPFTRDYIEESWSGKLDCLLGERFEKVGRKEEERLVGVWKGPVGVEDGGDVHIFWLN